MKAQVSGVKQLEAALEILRPGEELEVTPGSDLAAFIAKAEGFGESLEPLFGVEFHKDAKTNRFWFRKLTK